MTFGWPIERGDAGPANPCNDAQESGRPRPRAAFTLIELILVMGVLATLAAVIVPSLSGFLKGRTIAQEGRRFVALTQFARDEAVSSGISQIVWINPKQNQYGLREAPGFSRNTNATRAYPLNDQLTFQLDSSASLAFGEYAIHFLPDGEIEDGSVTNLAIEQPDSERLWIAVSTNGFNFEIIGNERL